MKHNHVKGLEPNDTIIKGDLDGKSYKISIVVASFNGDIAQGLLEGALKALDECGTTDIKIIETDGAFEIPLIAKQCANFSDAVVCLGAVIKGDTAHFDHVSHECARGIQDVMIETGKPIIFGVLTTYTDFQAKERSLPDSFNEGYEAANTAISMCSLLKQLV
ncbi:6,7-dimethyl-8-ribityllumazine synthase [bacterium]|nr:6,7-dimethyl-8-ribityllumazine synthase [bacterium]|tara:strand:+ start:1243 stop:1731 length:489 start_codon:yes stop_codon:yes gene_type:complete